jgi:glyoxylase-like metal-dependent hydrolase (beta-lactamase superfamily II)
MPRIIKLGRKKKSLNDLSVIVGEGLCSNIYVIGKDEATLIDTGIGNSLNPVLPQLQKLGVFSDNITKIVLTHFHHDHAMGTYIIQTESNPKIFIHKFDAKFVSNLGSNLIALEEGEVIETEKWPLEVISTPGHSPGSICLYSKNENILFSGDTVMPHGYFGRYDFEGGSLKSLIESLGKLSRLRVEVLFPGHGDPVLENGEQHVQLSYKNSKSLLYS